MPVLRCWSCFGGSHRNFGSKVGSLQRFVPLSTDMRDLGPSGIPIDQVHKASQPSASLSLRNRPSHSQNCVQPSPPPTGGPSAALDRRQSN